MNKEEAIQYMRNGGRVTHRWFTSDEYIWMCYDHIISEDDVDHGTIDDFFATRSFHQFESDWSIYKPNK